MVNKEVLGVFSCAGCGYRCHTPEIMKAHIEKFHPNLKEDIRNRYNKELAI